VWKSGELMQEGALTSYTLYRPISQLRDSRTVINVTN